MIKRIFLLIFIIVISIIFAWTIEIDLAVKIIEMEGLATRQSNTENTELFSVILGLGTIWIMTLLVMCHDLEQIPPIKRVKKSWNRRFRK